MMRWKIFLLLGILLFPIVNAGSVGISPAYYIEHFESNLEKTFEFRVFNSNESEGIGIVLEGDLAEYANLSNDYLIGGGRIQVSLKLPSELDKPGTHALYVRIFESKNQSNNFGGVASVRIPIRILVPYPGKYTESSFYINDINEGENAFYNLDIQNLGTEDLTLNTVVEVFRIDEFGEKVLESRLDDMSIETKRILNIEDKLNTSSLEAGNYFARATVDYGDVEVLNTTFRIGEFLVDIIDYDYLFERDKINEFNIEIENKWNTKIDSVYAEVTITDEGQVVSTFRTASLDTDPWEVKNITGFFDAEGFHVGRYLANINLYYGNETTHKLVAVYIQDPEKERNYYLMFILIGAGVVSIIIVLGFILLFRKIKILKEEVNEKK